MSKRKPSEEEFKMLDAMFSPNPEAWDNWVRSQGFEPVDADLPVCLAALPKSEWVACSRVVPTPGVQRYLDSDDILSQNTIDLMELSMERDYQTAPEYYITSETTGNEEDETLKVDHFWLGKDLTYERQNRAIA